MDFHAVARAVEDAGQGYALIIVDAFYRALPRGTDENDNAAIADLYNFVDRTAERSDAAIVLVHHSSKGSQAGKSVTDVGSGAGLPGVPLLAVGPDWRGVLLEPRQKRWAFLRLVVRELGLTAAVERSRYEDWQPANRERFDLVTARALGGHETLLRWARDRLSDRGRVVLWSTAEDELELRGLSGWHVLSSPLPSLSRGRLVQLVPCFT